MSKSNYTMTSEEYKSASEFWTEKEAESKQMPKEALMEAIEDYVHKNDTCALATASNSGDFVRCTPIEYVYYQKAFYMFTEGGLKFKGLESNSNVCIAIFDKFQGFTELKGMQVSGTAEVIEPYSEEYIAVAEHRKLSIDALKKLERTMHLLKITPLRIDFLNSDFRKDGYDGRQFIEL